MGEYGADFQNEPVDVSEEFARQRNHFFIGSKVPALTPEAASGEMLWKGLALKQRVSYHQLTLEFEDYRVWWDTPPGEYEDEQTFPFSLSFVTVNRDPARFEFRDASGGLLTRTWNLSDAKGVVNSMPTPFSFVRKSSNLHQHIAASFTLSPGEKLFGGGESFTGLNKRGQKMVLWAYDAYSVQTPNMYKPVPFFMSNRGYGMFVHTSAPLTFDLGGSYGEAAVIYLGDDVLDLFFFFGSPKEILSEYTALTGRAPTPPL